MTAGLTKQQLFFLRKSSNFTWGVAKHTPEVERHFWGEVSVKIYRVCKVLLSESSTLPLHHLTEKRFQQLRNGKWLCKFGLIYFPFGTMGGSCLLIHRWQGQLTRSYMLQRTLRISYTQEKNAKFLREQQNCPCTAQADAFFIALAGRKKHT